jgi:hypothetical protein
MSRVGLSLDSSVATVDAGGTEPRRLRALTDVASSTLIAAVVATAMAVLAITLRWRGADLPAHFFRVGLVERDGVEVWNNYWFGGHHTLGYGLLFPTLGAIVGIWTVAVASAATSAVLVDRLLIGALGRSCWPASLWFAIGTVTNIAIGRLPFALGMALGLGALVAAQRRRTALAAVLAAVTAFASPVVSVFLAIVFASWALISIGRQRLVAALLVVAAAVPVLVIAVLYPQGGTFPFRAPALAAILAACAGVWLLVPPDHRLVRHVAGLYGLASVAAFVVPTPLGANITRLGMYAAAPVLIALVPPRRLVLGLLLPLLWFWQWSPAFDSIVRAGRDSSTERAFYGPLVAFLETVDADDMRIEVVPTARHWEVAFVATQVPIARGWERQLDKRFNPLFYEPDLTPSAYQRWLLESGVGYVAVSDAPLDEAGKQEAALIEEGLPFLHLAWASDHWQVYEVIDASGLVDGPAELVELGVDTVALKVVAPGDVVVRVRHSEYWASDPPVCIESTDDGWIVLRHVSAGPLTVYLDEAAVLAAADPCAESGG